MIRKYLADGIPSEFCCFETELPFTHCKMCEDSLSATEMYVVEKVYRQNVVHQSREIVYEYAICNGCIYELGGDISEESRETITTLFTEHGENYSRKLDYLHRTEKYNIESWMERCSLTGKEIRLCEEFTLSGIIENNKLVYEQTPMVVSDSFIKLIQESLSKETKDSFNGLRDKILNDSPSVEDLIFSPTPGLI